VIQWGVRLVKLLSLLRWFYSKHATLARISCIVKKALFLYYSQAGQTQRAIAALAQGFATHAPCDVVRFETEETFPFPWRMSAFFRVFPRCIAGLAPPLKPLPIHWEDYDLIILGYQVWFLSPSLPVQSLLQSPQVEAWRGKKVITVVTCRNLWHSALHVLRRRLTQWGAIFLGQITLCELSPVWASFVTTPRWMLTGKKNAFAFFPPAGIATEEFNKLIEKGQRLGLEWAASAGTRVLSAELTANRQHLSLLMMDRIGAIFFRFWTRIILRLAPEPGWWQDFLLIIFRLNLIVLIICVAPCTRIFSTIVGNDRAWLERFDRNLD
jgi:hypothetical protein